MLRSGGSVARGSVFLVGLALLPLVVLPDSSLGGESVFLVPKLMWLAVVLVPAALALARGSGVRVRSLLAHHYHHGQVVVVVPLLLLFHCCCVAF